MTTTNVSFSGSVPQLYDEYMGPMLFEPYAIDLVGRLPRIQNAKILELACGTGRVTAHLAKALPQSQLIASDLNPDMIYVAQDRVKEGVEQWMVADMASLPFHHESFDIVVCQYGIMFVPDKQQAFREAFRVLKKGGSFLFNTWDKIENNGVPMIAERAVKDYFGHAAPTFFQVPFSMYDPDQLRSLAEEAGFTVRKIENVLRTGYSPSADNAARGLIQGSPVIKEIRERNQEAEEALVASAARIITETYGASPAFPLSAWVAEVSK